MPSPSSLLNSLMLWSRNFATMVAWRHTSALYYVRSWRVFSCLRPRLRWVGEGVKEELLISYSGSSNNCLLYSVASQVPGTVTVTVKSIRGNFLGETSFDYVDEVENVLQMLLRNRRLQARYFLLLAQELGNRSLSDPTDHVKEDKHPSEHFSSEKPGITLVEASFFLTLMIRVFNYSRQSLFSLAAFFCVCVCSRNRVLPPTYCCWEQSHIPFLAFGESWFCFLFFTLSSWYSRCGVSFNHNLEFIGVLRETVSVAGTKRGDWLRNQR